ncbi:MAG: osmoprotectant transport system permease protein [Pseudonocardiales bacterium]|nr:osmoprotectant transport system permease protein [Pseudonocardiales bacterium]
MNIWDYFRGDQSEILGWLRTTLWLAAVPVVVGLIISLPVGWVASRFRWTYPPLVSVAGLLYTVPSIVLFLVLPGILGTGILDPVNIAVALSIYSVALLVRVVADGFSAVDENLLQAAAAMGYTGAQRVVRVQLPLAVPVIGAGLRVAAVSNVSLVAVASTLGVSQLGSLFTAGYNATVNGSTPILLGLVMFVLVALVFDWVILFGVRLATPWRRAAAAR